MTVVPSYIYGKLTVVIYDKASTRRFGDRRCDLHRQRVAHIMNMIIESDHTVREQASGIVETDEMRIEWKFDDQYTAIGGQS